MPRDVPELVWNKGIAALCHARIPDEFPGGGPYTSMPTLAGAIAGPQSALISNPAHYLNLPDGALVWVRLAWLKPFIEQVLPLLTNHIVLVTGDSDGSTPSEAMPDARLILESPKVIRWWAQNCDGSVPRAKVSPVPIGIDFHTLSERPFWGESTSTPLEQELTLKSIRDRLPPIQDRIPRVYLDFAWQMDYESRDLPGAKCLDRRPQIITKLLNNKLCFLQKRLPRSKMWKKRGEYMFVLSPHGHGLDCHRTWEALALGHIVVTTSSSLDPLYEGMPVITVDSYDAITEDNLRAWQERFACGSNDHPKLTSRYWAELMREAPSFSRVQNLQVG